MTRLWDSFSILIVLSLLVLLVPAAVVMGPPVAQVAKAQAGVLEEMYGSISLTETTSGSYYSFTAGSAELDVVLEQYTRQEVVRSSTLASQFRHLSNLTGTVSGNLSGNLVLRGHGFIFNQDYPYTPEYYDGTRFGHMVGHGEFDDGSGNTFYLVFVYDYDANSDVSSAAGKGFMFSYSETGDFAGHKVIGEFNLTKSGTSYTGNYFLRNYAPSEIQYLGWINATGEVDVFDGELIADPARCAFFNLTAYGAYHDISTAADEGPCFDELDWGEDRAKTVDEGWIGANGSIDGSRNGVLDSGRSGSFFDTGVEAEGALVQWIEIDDTFGTTGDPTTTNGTIYSLLALDFPFFDGNAGDHLLQYGLSFLSFGMYYQTTEDYVGTESYGDSLVGIITAISTPYDYYSNSRSYSLLPFPRPLSCNPDNGSRGDSMNVTISGRYFTRVVSAFDGDLSFGPGIDVNAYSVSGTDLSGTIEANISINATATPGYRTINATSGFSNGTATVYRSGLLTNGFQILAGNQTPTTPTNITCDAGTCDKDVDTSVTLQASGSTDNESDPITYYLEASLLNVTTVQNTTDVRKAGEGGAVESIAGISTACYDSELSGGDGYEFYSQWTFPGSGDVTLTKLRYWQHDTSLTGSESIEMALYNSGGSIISEITTATGTGASGWVNATLNTPISVTLGQTYYVGVGPDVGAYDIARDDSADCSSPNVGSYYATASGGLDNTVPTGSQSSRKYTIWGIVYEVGGPSNETTTTYTTYNNVNGDFDSVTNVTIKVEVDSYDPSASVAQATSDPDLELDIYNGSAFDNIGVFDLPSTYTGTGKDTTNHNFTLFSTDAAILSAWASSANQDFRIRGVHMDWYNDTTVDEINYTNVWATVDGKRWIEIGTHAEGNTLVWNTTALPNQTCVDLRARARDITGSGQYSDYYTKGCCLNISHAVAPTTSDITGTVYEANTSVVAGADVVLSGPLSDSTTTNASGYYNFTVNQTGNYTVNVTKDGLTYADKWANVTNLGDDVTVDFKGVDAPYRTAPDGLYVIKCSNLWLFGAYYPPGFALNGKRLSDVVYAWVHPS